MNERKLLVPKDKVKTKEHYLEIGYSKPTKKKLSSNQSSANPLEVNKKYTELRTKTESFSDDRLTHEEVSLIQQQRDVEENIK